MRTIALTEETRKNVLENLLKRSPSSYGKFEDAVAEIVENVRNNKDAAVFEYTKRFDECRYQCQKHQSDKRRD